jgi:Undecaprenyl-phosphate galactose phosphotransferase WbaP
MSFKRGIYKEKERVRMDKHNKHHHDRFWKMSPLSGSHTTRLITILLVVSDLLSVAISFLIAFFLRKYAPFLDPLVHGIDIYLNAWPALILWPLIFWREGLYPGFWLPVREELRRTVTGTTLASILAMALTFVTKTGPEYSRPIIVGGWLMSIFIMPATRFLLRKVITKLGLSGPRTVILGAGKTAELILNGLRKQRPPALKPIGLFDDDQEKIGGKIEGVPIIGGIADAASWAIERGVHVAIVAMPGLPRARLVPMIEKQIKVFQRIVVIPDLFGISAADADAYEIQGTFALELRRNLLYRWNRIAKRLIDVMLLLFSLAFLIPLTLLIALAIVLETGRPVFFKHERIGRGGKPFTAWKYRTMYEKADVVFEKTLKDDPELRKEWEKNHKLKNDPRLTKVGSILRRLSLDEFPQLWNVLKGEMSLVGPRPIVEKEIEKYGDDFDLYTQVLPGLTGLWQVSGRSNLSYQERVWLDTHYVRNWSVWLDLVILVRTVWVVIAGVGAY